MHAILDSSSTFSFWHKIVVQLSILTLSWVV